MTRLQRAVLLGALAALAAVPAAAATIAGSKHDLSVGGEGPVTAFTEKQICLFCHIPHRATPGPALANRLPGETLYQKYASSTAWSIPDQPGGTSTLCLGCHDGTIALGSLTSRDIAMANTAPGGFMPSGATLLGTDLSSTHPVSTVFPLNKPGYHLPPATDRVRLDGEGKIQCASCHDPHDPEWVPFLVKRPFDPTGARGGAVCLSCHLPPGWTNGAHAVATGAVVPLVLSLPGLAQTTVAQVACQGCHRLHHADEPPRLGRGAPADRCLICHDGTVAPDVRTELTMVYRHTVGQGKHDAVENLRALPVPDRHSECADCHDPHAAGRTAANAGPAAPGSLRGVGGVNAQYVSGPWTEPTATPVPEVAYEYQLCFKCHSAWSYGLSPPVSPTRRLLDGLSAPPQTSPALGFNSNNGGLHAVIAPHPNAGTGAPGAFRGTDRSGVPWSWDSILLCTDCHGPEVNWPGPAGPHGSSQGFILRGSWIHASASGDSVLPATGTTGTEGHLCFLCHDPLTYLEGYGVNTGFRTAGGNNLHGGLYHRVACASCHSAVPHGYRRRAMLVETTQPYPYNAGSRLKFVRDLLGNPILPASGFWAKTDCDTDCHHGP